MKFPLEFSISPHSRRRQNLHLLNWTKGRASFKCSTLFIESGGLGQPLSPNPCLNCGACCAFFRVQFYWREANKEDCETPVPEGLWEDLTENMRCMRGTNAKHRPGCKALSGRVGVDAKCSIYLNRPSPCRAFSASYSAGVKNERCDEARRAHGLPPLRPEDWR